MKGHLSDLDELLQSVRYSSAKEYLSEAISTYRSGSYRASIISTWISVCVDIVEKIRELSHAGDQAAIAIANRLDKIQGHDFTAMLQFEKDLLNIAEADLELISPIEKAHLERLKDDRNICAHPTFSSDGAQFNPGPEMARSYIVQAATYLLIHTPVKGKVVINSTFNLISEDSFPKDREKIFSILSSPSYLGRARDSSIRNLCIILLKRIFKDDAKIPQDYLRKIAFSLDAISRINSHIFSTVMTEKFLNFISESDQKRMVRIFPLLLYKMDLWAKLDEPTIHRLEGALDALSVEDIINLKVVELSDQIGEISKFILKRAGKLESQGIIKLLEATPSNCLKQYAIKEFSGSPNFAAAYSRGTNILLPHSEFFGSDDLTLLFDSVFSEQKARINQVLSAGGIDSVFAQVYKETKSRVHNHSVLWLGFWEKAEKYSLHDLRSELEADKLVDPLPPAEDDDWDDIPPF